MYLVEDTLDDLMKEVLERLLALDSEIKATRGTTKELLGVLLHLKNPRARLSRTETKGKPFSAIGELLWYLSGSNELSFIYYYIKQYADDSDDGLTIYGGYGPRLLNARGKYNQVENVINLLKARPASRKAVIQLFDAKDIDSEHKEIPCTCNLQFFVRDEKLHMMTHMRSNDAFLGLPHDIFAFTMLQEIIARELSVELGEYRHSVGSLHLYESSYKKASAYISEGWQPTKLEMPAMPTGSLYGYIKRVKEAELMIRSGYNLPNSFTTEHEYWNDIVRLLQVFSHKKRKDKNVETLLELKGQMHDNVYDTYIDKVIDSANSVSPS